MIVKAEHCSLWPKNRKNEPETVSILIEWDEMSFFSLLNYWTCVAPLINSPNASWQGPVLGWLHVIEAYKATKTPLPVNLKVLLVLKTEISKIMAYICY